MIFSQGGWHAGRLRGGPTDRNSIDAVPLACIGSKAFLLKSSRCFSEGQPLKAGRQQLANIFASQPAADPVASQPVS